MRQGLSKRRLAADSGLQYQTIYRMSHGEVGIGRVSAIKLAKALDVSPGWLMLVDDAEPQSTRSLTISQSRALEVYQLLFDVGPGFLEACIRIAARYEYDPVWVQAVRRIGDQLELIDSDPGVAQRDAARRRKRPSRRGTDSHVVPKVPAPVVDLDAARKKRTSERTARARKTKPRKGD